MPALIAALTGGTTDALTKKALQLHDEYTVAWLRQLLVVLLLSPCLFFIPVPAMDGEFYNAFFSALPFEVVAYIFYMKAIKISPLSLTVPFLSLTPVCPIMIPLANMRLTIHLHFFQDYIQCGIFHCAKPGHFQGWQNLFTWPPQKLVHELSELSSKNAVLEKSTTGNTVTQ